MSARPTTLSRLLRAPLTPAQDAFGRLLRDLVAGREVVEVVERDDGCIFAGDPSYYLAPLRSWWPQERRAMRFVRGRVLDLGCGAGRVGLHLQARGHDVVGIDVSPLAVQVAQERGLADARVGTVDAVHRGEQCGSECFHVGVRRCEEHGRVARAHGGAVQSMTRQRRIAAEANCEISRHLRDTVRLI